MNNIALTVSQLHKIQNYMSVEYGIHCSNYIPDVGIELGKATGMNYIVLQVHYNVQSKGINFKEFVECVFMRQICISSR